MARPDRRRSPVPTSPPAPPVPPPPPPTALEQLTRMLTRRAEYARDFRESRTERVAAYKDKVAATSPGGLDWGPASYFLEAHTASYGLRDAESLVNAVLGEAKDKDGNPREIKDEDILKWLRDRIADQTRTLLHRDDYRPNSTCPVSNLLNICKYKAIQETRVFFIRLEFYYARTAELAAADPDSRPEPNDFPKDFEGWF